MSLDRPHLELLAAVLQHAQLGAAARALNISPSAASHRMRDAERRTGLQLIEQHGRVVRLTRAGRYLAEAASSLEHQLAEAEVIASLIDNGRRPRVRVALDFYDAAPWIADVPTDDTALVDLVRVPADGALSALHRRVVDLAIFPVSTLPSGVETTTLCDDRLVAVVPSAPHALASSEPIGAAELATQPYFAVGLDPQQGFEFHEFFAPSGHVPQKIVRIESLQLVLSIVARGLGVTIQPRAAVPPRDDLTVRPLTGDPIVVQWIAITLESPAEDVSALIARAAAALSANRLTFAGSSPGTPPVR
jgi:LysR family transcriptional regulator for metE and metH